MGGRKEDDLKLNLNSIHIVIITSSMINNNFLYYAGLLRLFLWVKIKQYKIKSRWSKRMGKFECE